MYSPELPHPLSPPPSGQDFDVLSPPSSDGMEFNLGTKDEDDKVKKRQVRLLKNRQSAALSRTRKKEYIQNLEGRAQELQMATNDLKNNLTVLATNNQETLARLEFLEKQLLNMVNDNKLLKSKLNIVDNNNKNNNTNNDNRSSNSRDTMMVDNNNNNNNNKKSHHISLRVPSSLIRENEIIIGMNKMMNKTASASPSPVSFMDTSNDNSNNNNNNCNISNVNTTTTSTSTTNNTNILSPFLSVSNPNVNSQPEYLSRARAASYHPSNENYKPTLPTITSNTPSSSDQSTTNTFSPVLPSLHQLTKAITPTLGSSPPARKNLLGYYHFNQQQQQQQQ